jgi:hypothetical protein
VGAAVGVERCNLGMQANLGDKGDEGKEPSSLEPRVGATRVTKAKGHHHWSRVWERRWVSKDAQVMHNLATLVTKAENPHRQGHVCGGGGGCREMQLGNGAAAMNALPCSRNGNLRSNQNPILMGAGAGSGHANAGHQPHQISAAEHRAASLGLRRG